MSLSQVEVGFGCWTGPGEKTLSISRRFLRARKFEVEAAWTQFKDTEDWRRDIALDKLYENIDVDSYEEARRMVRFPARLNIDGYRVQGTGYRIQANGRIVPPMDGPA